MRQNPHVRICGGPGSASTLVYPTIRGQRSPALSAAMLSSPRSPSKTIRICSSAENRRPVRRNLPNRLLR